MSDRARQFLPFASLKGYYEMIHEKEKIKEEKRELQEEELVGLSNILKSLKKGMMLRIKFYQENAYTSRIGKLTEINEAYHYLVLVKEKIQFEDILEIEMIEE